MEARPLLPPRRRGHARRRRARMPHRARRASACSTPPPSARSRSSAPTRPSSWTACTSTPGQARAGPLPLRRHAARERLRPATTASSAASRPTASTSPPPPAAPPACSAMMEDYLQTEWPDLQRLAHLDHRAMGRHRRPGPARARRCWRRWSRASTSAAHAAYERARGPRLRRPRAAVPRQLHRRAAASRSTSPPITAAPCGRRCARRVRRAAAALYGTEAMHVLRAEKGYIIVGQETDGTVTPDDSASVWAIGKTQARLRRQALAGDWPSLARARPPATGRPVHPRRASARRKAPSSTPEPGGPPAGPRHLRLSTARRSATRSRWRCSRTAAPASARRVLLQAPSRPGARRVSSRPVFIDPEGARLHA